MSDRLQRLHANKLFWLLTLAVLLCVGYIGLALTPSSYAAGLEWLGLPKKGLFLGHPQAIRSDEWIVFTPYIQIAVANSFAATNGISPYHEDLRAFLSLPIVDWALLFKPYHWGFFVLPAANAYSLYFLCNALAFLIGWTVLLSKLRVDIRLAALAALAFYFSQFIQVWWSSNSGVFAYAPWPAIAWLHFAHRGLRISLTAYALLVWLLSCAYPPFIYASALAVGTLLLACRADLVDRKRLFDACISASIALGLFIAYFSDLIDVMQGTVYPGHRESTGGGIEYERLLAHLYPFFAIDGYEPLARFKNSNACEVAVLSTLLPLFALCVLDYRSVGASVRHHLPRVAIVATGLAFMAAWMTLPISGLPAKITGLFTTPPNRMLLGFGILLNAAAAIALAKCQLKLTPLRLSLAPLLLAAAAAAKWWHSGEGIDTTFNWREAAMLLIVIGLCAYLAIATSHEFRKRMAIFAAAALVNLTAFGLFNPVQSAYPIFSLDQGRLRASLAERGALRVGEYYVVPGQYGALLAGAGIPAINHTLLQPQLSFFRRLFPDMPQDEFNLFFNRYEHISLHEEDAPRLAGPDHVFLPMAAFIGDRGGQSVRKPAFVPENVAVTALAGPPPYTSLPATAAFGHIDTIARANGTIVLQGWIRAIAAKARLQVWISPAAGPIGVVTARRPDVANLVDRALLDSGVRITVAGADGREREICILVQDQDGRVSTVQFPDGSKTCTRLR